MTPHRFSPTRSSLALLAALTTAGLLAGCGARSEPLGAPKTQSLRLMLDYLPNADHAGIYTALATGEFKRSGLSVQLATPTDPASPLKLVAAGKVDLAISYQPEVLLARSHDVRVLSVAALASRPLTSLMSTGGRSVRPSTLGGKTVGTAGIPYQSAYLKQILTRAGVDPASVKEINVGFMYEQAHGVKQDYAESFRWYMKAAEQGNPDAENNVGAAYAHGQGVKQDMTQAITWLTKAADQGQPIAQTNLGVIYATADGAVKQNFPESLKRYYQAAKQGYASAEYSLGLMCAQGQGTRQDYAQAAQWYRRAADKGFGTAQNDLGVLYHTGNGVTKNDEEAYFWLNLAAAADPKFTTNRDKVMASLKPEQVKAVQARSREWKPMSAAKQPEAAAEKAQ